MMKSGDIIFTSFWFFKTLDNILQALGVQNAGFVSLEFGTSLLNKSGLNPKKPKT